jgi:nucleotide-binding universal stress UspA family protein
MGDGMWQQFREAQERRAKNVLIGKRSEDLRVRKALADFYGVNAEARRSFDDYEIAFREGKVADEVTKVVDEFDCQVIVMGAHKGVRGRSALGSGAKGVLTHARVPVLVVPPPA